MRLTVFLSFTFFLMLLTNSFAEESNHKKAPDEATSDTLATSKTHSQISPSASLAGSKQPEENGPVSADMLLVRNEQTLKEVPGKGKRDSGYEATEDSDTPENHLKSIGGRIPKEYKLYPAFPEPGGSVIPLHFDIPRLSGPAAAVELTIYNNLGQKINTVYQGELAAGSYEILWQADNQDGLPAGPGTYYAIFKTEFFQQVMKIVLTL